MARTLQEQTNSLAAYLPIGKLWGAAYQRDTVTRGLLAGLSGELLRNAALVEEFRDQIIPDKTVLFLDEWERALGIPDACFTGEGTDDERRNDILAKLASLGVQTSEDMRRLALTVYGVALTIRNPSRDPDNVFPYTFNPTGEADPDGDGGDFVFNLSDREARFQIIIEYDSLPTPVLFPLNFPIPFGTREVATIECLFAQLRPANVGFTEDIPIPTDSPSPPPEPPIIPTLLTTNSIFYDAQKNGFDTTLGARTEPDGATNVDTGWPAASGAMTVAVWARHMTSLGGDILYCLQFPDAGTRNRIRINQAGTERIQASLETTAANRKRYDTEIAETPAVDTWYHYAFTYDGGNAADSLKIYTNGVLNVPIINEDDDISTLSSADMAVSIGGSSTLPFEGNHTIFHLSTWNRALSSAEIAAIGDDPDTCQHDLNANLGAYSSTGLQNFWVQGLNNVANGMVQDSGPKNVPLTFLVDIDDTDLVTDSPDAPAP